MRTSLLCLLWIVLLCPVEIFAQKHQVTEDYIPPLDIPMEGKIKYSYIVDNDGDNLKDGPLTVKAGVENLVTYVMLRKVTINGNYNLTANYMNGNMNGALSLNSKIAYRYGSETKTESYTLRGSFKGGIPHGNFQVNYLTSIDVKMNVNFDNGKLVGPYMVDYSTLLVDKENIKGTLTQSGELTGRWDFTYFDNSRKTYNFQNGICLSISGKKHSTPPALIEKARQLANGNITEDELRKQGIMVFEDSIDLGIHAKSIIMRDDVIKFKDLGGYDFSTSNIKKFKYLKNMAYLTDEGFNLLLNSIKEAIVENEYTIYNFGEVSRSKDQCEKVVGTDENGMRYVKLGTHNYYLTTVGEYKGVTYDKVYLTEEQSATLPGKVEEIRKDAALDLIGYLKMIYKDYDFDSKFGVMERLHRVEPSINDIASLYDNLSGIRLDTLYASPDMQFLSFKVITGTFYVKKSATEELENMKSELLKSIKDYFRKTYLDIEIDYNESVVENMDKLDYILQNLNFLVNKSSTSIAYDDDSYRYFCTDGVEDQQFWKLELGKRIKKFTKITHIRLTGINNDKVFCEFTRKGKNIYQTSINLKDKKIVVSSIDFTGAKLISGE